MRNPPLSKTAVQTQLGDRRLMIALVLVTHQRAALYRRPVHCYNAVDVKRYLNSHRQLFLSYLIGCSL